MNITNTSIIINYTNTFIKKINNYLWNSNSNTITNFIQLETHSVIITTKQATSFQDMNIIKNCIKESKNIDSEHIDNL